MGGAVEGLGGLGEVATVEGLEAEFDAGAGALIAGETVFGVGGEAFLEVGGGFLEELVGLFEVAIMAVEIGEEEVVTAEPLLA